ncbi:MAG: C25 family cysteine peptidase, partial [Myxococcota bacterium]
MNRICMFTLFLIACDGEDKNNTTDTADVQTEPNDTGEATDTSEQDDTGDDTDTDPPPPPQDVSVFMLEVSTTDADWRDLAYLATIPASTHTNDGTPAVLAVENIDTPTVPTVDLLERLSPDNAYVMSTETSVDQAETTTGLDADGAEHWSLVLAETFWETSEYAVVVSADDYPAATLGASLAARLGAPMLVAESDTEAIAETISALGAETLVLGLDVEPPALAVDHTPLDGLDSVLSWIVTHDLGVSYLTVSNTNDRLSGRSQKASLLAPMYAANRGGLSLPITLDMPTLVVDDGGDHPVTPFLADVYDQLGTPPTHLAIVGAHDALPQMRKPTIFDNPLEEQPVSDLPYGEIDDDAFVDIAIGRIIGDTVEELATIATRTAQYEQLQDGNWERNFVESGLWGFDELRDITLNVGFDPPQHLSQTEINAESSLEIGVFLHKDHSYCQVLGNAFDTYSNTLFAPAVVVSRGCSVGGMDLLDDTQRSIVDH